MSELGTVNQPIEVVWPAKVYTHETCQTDWPAPRCTCRRYALRWILPHATWAVGEGGAMPILPAGVIPTVSRAVPRRYRSHQRPPVPQPILPQAVQPPRVQRQKPLIVSEVEPAPVMVPDLRIPEHLRELCTREDLHPEQRDYVVIPVDQVETYQPLPPWVVASKHVKEMQVVKPRLDRDAGKSH